MSKNKEITSFFFFFFLRMAERKKVASGDSLSKIMSMGSEALFSSEKG